MNVLLATNITITDAAVFTVAALGCLVGALGVVLARNTVHAALALVLTLFGIAVLFIEQEADFLAAVQVIVYAGAVVVLFLFVIMFLGVDRREEFGMEVLSAQRPVSAV
ncbi:MAG: NADH-quinone oxidoreductase subunit J, partial [Actinobacteria bacterium]|nr:NADH-quinone oxidoreductase subunit J [Actinomycetota bacterium]